MPTSFHYVWPKTKWPSDQNCSCFFEKRKCSEASSFSNKKPITYSKSQFWSLGHFEKMKTENKTRLYKQIIPHVQKKIFYSSYECTFRYKRLRNTNCLHPGFYLLFSGLFVLPIKRKITYWDSNSIKVFEVLRSKVF